MSLTSIVDLDRATAEEIAAVSSLDREYEEQLLFEAKYNDGSDRKPGIHASEISHCVRQAVYTCLSFDKKDLRPDADIAFWARKFEAGKALHANIQGVLRRAARRSNGAFTFEDEVGIHPGLGGVAAEYGVYSSCDGVFTLYSDGKPSARLGLEIKSASYREFPTIRAPKPDHILQSHLYMACLDLPLMWVLYYNKGDESTTSMRGPFLFRFDPTLWGGVMLPRLELCRDSTETGSIPDREEGVYCRFCKYAWVCAPQQQRRRA